MAKAQGRQLAIQVSVVTIIGNLALTLFKLIAGIVAHSGAMMSDAIHSGSDMLSTFVVIAGVKLSGKASDKEHPYGHERFECVAALLLAFLLAITGIGIGWTGVKNIINYNGELVTPGLFALIAALISIVVKEAMYWYTRSVAKKLDSGALMADAWHHRSDALSSIGSFVGILGARMGFPVLDPIASVVICAFILKVAVEIFVDSVKKMMDTTCDSETVEEMKKMVCSVDGVVSIDNINTRLFGNRIYVDIEISANGLIKLVEAHKIAEQVHLLIESQFPNVKHCMVHVNPICSDDGDSKIQTKQ